MRVRFRQAFALGSIAAFLFLFSGCTAETPTATPTRPRPVSPSPTAEAQFSPTPPPTLCIQEQYDQQEPDGSVTHVWYMCSGDYHKLIIATAPPPPNLLAPIPAATYIPRASPPAPQPAPTP